MAKYGNILTVYDCNDIAVQQIKTIFKESGVEFKIKENTFFIETNSKQNTKDLINSLSLSDIQFIFFHNHNSDGSVVEAKGIEADFLKEVTKILLF